MKTKITAITLLLTFFGSSVYAGDSQSTWVNVGKCEYTNANGETFMDWCS